MTSEQRRVVLTLGFCGLVSAADNWFVSPALPAIAQTLAVAPSVVAVILTAYLVPYGALQPVCGAIGDRVGRVRLLRVIVAGLAVGAFLSSDVRTFFGPGRAVFLIAFTTGIIYLGIYGFMGTFLAERCGLSSTPAGLLMMFYGLACLAGGSLSGWIGGWRGLRGTILVGEASGLAAAGLLLVSTVTGSWVPALVAAACLGLGYILVQPTLVSLSMDVDPAQTGLCTGLIGFGVFVGGGAGSTLGGFAISAGGYEALWIAGAAALALQTVIGWQALPQT